MPLPTRFVSTLGGGGGGVDGLLAAFGVLAITTAYRSSWSSDTTVRGTPVTRWRSTFGSGAGGGVGGSGLSAITAPFYFIVAAPAAMTATAAAISKSENRRNQPFSLMILSVRPSMK